MIMMKLNHGAGTLGVPCCCCCCFVYSKFDSNHHHHHHHRWTTTFGSIFHHHHHSFFAVVCCVICRLFQWMNEKKLENFYSGHSLLLHVLLIYQKKSTQFSSSHSSKIHFVLFSILSLIPNTHTHGMIGFEKIFFLSKSHDIIFFYRFNNRNHDIKKKNFFSNDHSFTHSVKHYGI